jgi:hypothetical protein
MTTQLELQISDNLNQPMAKTPHAPQPHNAAALQEPDERFPGSFFRIPGVPVPGKTGWRLAE